MFNDSFSDINNFNEIFGVDIFNEIKFNEDYFDKSNIKQSYFTESTYDFLSLQLKRENVFGKKQNIQNENSSFNIPNTLNHIIIEEDKNVGRKRKRPSVNGKTHDKFADDNLREKK